MKAHFFLITTFLCGCQSIPSAPAILAPADGQKGYFVDFPAERRGAWNFITKIDGKETHHLCTEPPTDVGLSTTQILSLAADLKKIDTSAKLDSSMASALVELKGRTPAVLALRDVMYRMCEARVSQGKLNDQDIAIYKEIISVIRSFAMADLENAQTEKAKVLGLTRDTSQAREYENRGYAALSKMNWTEALQSFESCEREINGFRACYDLARAIRTTDKKNR